MTEVTFTEEHVRDSLKRCFPKKAGYIEMAPLNEPLSMSVHDIMGLSIADIFDDLEQAHNVTIAEELVRISHCSINSLVKDLNTAITAYSAPPRRVSSLN